MECFYETEIDSLAPGGLGEDTLSDEEFHTPVHNDPSSKSFDWLLESSGPVHNDVHVEREQKSISDAELYGSPRIDNQEPRRKAAKKRSFFGSLSCFSYPRVKA